VVLLIRSPGVTERWELDRVRTDHRPGSGRMRSITVAWTKDVAPSMKPMDTLAMYNPIHSKLATFSALSGITEVYQ
jgi:hypothetical protein